MPRRQCSVPGGTGREVYLEKPAAQQTHTNVSE